MRYRNTIIALGFIALVLLTPIVGIPDVWKHGAAGLAVLAMVVLAYLAGKERTDVQA